MTQRNLTECITALSLLILLPLLSVPLFLLLCTSCACVFHFPPICFPQNSHMCIQGHWCLAAARVSRLAVGLISAAFLGPGQIHTYTHTQTHKHTPSRDSRLCIGCVQRHLEEVKHKRAGETERKWERERERCPSQLPHSPCHASATPHNSSLCSALLGFQQTRLPGRSRADALDCRRRVRLRFVQIMFSIWLHVSHPVPALRGAFRVAVGLK